MKNLDEILPVFFLFLGGVISASFMLPRLIKFAAEKNLIDVPNWRSAHAVPIPSIGGVSFLPILIFTTIIGMTTESLLLSASVAGMSIMGFFDDKYDLGFKVKFLVQIIIVTAFFAAGVRITSMFGIFGIYELNIYLSYAVTLMVMIGVINAYNLIDGIDGLAGGLGLIGSLAFGVVFLLSGDFVMASIAFGFAGGLLGFLRYNFNPAKIFMGDTGSLVLGLVMAIFFVKSLTISNTQFSAMGIGVLLLPLLDMTRLFLSRMKKGVSPFKADKNHYHHLLLKSGDNHRVAALRCYLFSILLLGFGYFWSLFYELATVFYCVVGLGIMIYAVVEFRFYKSKKRKQQELKQQLDTTMEDNQLLKHML